MPKQLLYRGSLTPKVIPKYTKELTLLSQQGKMKAPFQFAIPIMAAMYSDFQTNWFLSHEQSDDVVTNLPEKLMVEPPPWGNLDPAYDNDHRLPQESPIRAIAYFSWEESSRIFLARRVYPSYYNFLSYSHCSEQWGALGIMVGQLEDKKSNYFNKTGKGPQYGFTEIKQFSQAALPFLAEVERIKYSAIFAMPVVEDRSTYSSTNNLHGAFLVFVNDKSYLPRVYLRSRGGHYRFATWVQSVTTRFKKTLDAQEALFFPNENNKYKPLAGYWRERIRRHRNLEVYELKVSAAQDAMPSSLDSIISGIMASLSNSEFHAIVDRDKSKRNRAVLLVATAEDTDKDLVKPGILRAVGVACRTPSLFRVTLRKLGSENRIYNL